MDTIHALNRRQLLGSLSALVALASLATPLVASAATLLIAPLSRMLSLSRVVLVARPAVEASGLSLRRPLCILPGVRPEVLLPVHPRLQAIPTRCLLRQRVRP